MLKVQYYLLLVIEMKDITRTDPNNTWNCCFLDNNWWNKVLSLRHVFHCNSCFILNVNCTGQFWLLGPFTFSKQFLHLWRNKLIQNGSAQSAVRLIHIWWNNSDIPMVDVFRDMPLIWMQASELYPRLVMTTWYLCFCKQQNILESSLHITITWRLIGIHQLLGHV